MRVSEQIRLLLSQFPCKLMLLIPNFDLMLLPAWQMILPSVNPFLFIQHKITAKSSYSGASCDSIPLHHLLICYIFNTCLSSECVFFFFSTEQNMLVWDCQIWTCYKWVFLLACTAESAACFQHSTLCRAVYISVPAVAMAAVTWWGLRRRLGSGSRALSLNAAGPRGWTLTLKVSFNVGGRTSCFVSGWLKIKTSDLDWPLTTEWRGEVMRETERVSVCMCVFACLTKRWTGHGGVKGRS